MSYIESPSLVTNPFFKIKITHLPTNQLISLPGWVTQFSDNFTSNWNQQNVYGRMDPLATFENTQRQITLAFDVVSANLDEAIANLASVNKLIEFLYPVYENSAGPSNARTIQNVLNAAPLIGLEWTNLVSRPGDGTKLVGFLRGANYSPEITEGGFVKGTKQIIEVEGEGEMNLDTNAVESQLVRGTTTKKAFIPKKLNVSLDYTVLHTHLTGWYKDAAGNYVFGDSSINGGFPNAHTITYQKEETFTQVTNVTEEAEEVIATAFERAEFEQIAQSEILGGGS